MPAKKTKNQIMFSGITEKTITIEIAAEDESVAEDIASYTETVHDESMDMINGIIRIKYKSYSIFQKFLV